MQAILKIFLLLCTNILLVSAAYDPNGHNIALYWGAGAGQERLSYYCESGAADIVMISFLNNWNQDSASYNFGNACGKYPAVCPQIEEDIKTCQSLGIKVLLSLGGDDRVGLYGLKNTDEGVGLANVVYNMFHPKGTGNVKPFGSAEIDGLDFDIENHNDKGLAAMVLHLRSIWTTKVLLMSACPQCPYPDKNVLNLLKDKDAKIDMAFIQYYNNPCGLKHPGKFAENWKIWEKFQQEDAGNSNLKLYVALAGSKKSNYNKSPSDVKDTTKDALKFSQFGGYCIWDAASAFGNIDKSTGLNYAYGIRNIIRNEKKYTSTIASTYTSATTKANAYNVKTTSVSTAIQYINSTFIATRMNTLPNTTYVEIYNTTSFSASTKYSTKIFKTKTTSYLTSISVSSLNTKFTYLSEVNGTTTEQNQKRLYSGDKTTSLSTKLGTMGDSTVITVISTINYK